MQYCIPKMQFTGIYQNICIAETRASLNHTAQVFLNMHKAIQVFLLVGTGVLAAGVALLSTSKVVICGTLSSTGNHSVAALLISLLGIITLSVLAFVMHQFLEHPESD